MSKLSNGEILATYQHTFNSSEGCARSAPNSLPSLVYDFARAIESIANQEKDKRIKELEALVEKLKDDGINKIMAMTDEQIFALSRLEGSNPDDIVKLAKKTFELASAKVRIAELEAALQSSQPQVSDALKTWPERIWLQMGDEFGDGEIVNFEEISGEEITWCADSIDSNDIEYIRADLALQSIPASKGGE